MLFDGNFRLNPTGMSVGNSASGRPNTASVVSPAPSPFSMFQRTGRVTASGGMDIGTNSGAQGTPMNIRGTGIHSDFTIGMLHGLVDTLSQHALFTLYEDIYKFDGVLGLAIDLKSSIPFSEFMLSGIRDHKVMSTYAKCADYTNLYRLLPGLSTGYLAMGESVSTLNFDVNEGVFVSVMPQDIKQCDVYPVPIYGMDPLVDLKISPAFKEMLTKQDPRLADMHTYVPNIEELRRQDVIRVDPNRLLYLARKPDATSQRGVSILQRALAYYLYEKALLRGTIELVYQRQKAITHVAVGGDFENVASMAEIQSVIDTVAQAALDPINAIIGTRDNVQINQLAAANDFWKLDDTYEALFTMKSRAVGFSEDMLTGTANYNTLDKSLTVTIEGFRNHRNGMVRDVVYEKLFLVTADHNGFTREKYGNKNAVHATAHRTAGMGMFTPNGDRVIADASGEYYALIGGYGDGMSKLSFRNVDAAKFVMPRLTFVRELKPQGDDAYLAQLNTMKDMGLPIPLRMIAAAGNINMDELLSGALDEDIAVRQRIMDYNKRVPKPAADLLDQVNSAYQGDPRWNMLERNRATQNDPVLSAYANSGNLSRKGRAVMEEQINRHLAPIVQGVSESFKARDAEEMRAAYESGSPVLYVAGSGAKPATSVARPLYVYRELPTEGNDGFYAWIQRAGLLGDVIALGDMPHVTVAFSRNPVKREDFTPDGSLVIYVQNTSLDVLGKSFVLVLGNVPELEARWAYYRRGGCSWDYPSYIPHVSLAKLSDPSESSRFIGLQPYTGALRFSPERVEDLRLT